MISCVISGWSVADTSAMFEIDGESFASNPDREFGDRSMNTKLKSVLDVGMRFKYEYDFGSSTDLKLKVVSEFCGKKRRKASSCWHATFNPLFHALSVENRPHTSAANASTTIPAGFATIVPKSINVARRCCFRLSTRRVSVFAPMPAVVMTSRLIRTVGRYRCSG